MELEHNIQICEEPARAHSPGNCCAAPVLSIHPSFLEFPVEVAELRNAVRADAPPTGVHKLRELARSRAGTLDSCSAASAGNRVPPEGLHAPRPGGGCAAQRRRSTKRAWPHRSRGPKSRRRTERDQMRESAGCGAFPRRDRAGPLRRATCDGVALLWCGRLEWLEAEAISDAKKAALDQGSCGSQQDAGTQAAEASRDESRPAEGSSTESRTESKSRAEVGGGGCSCPGPWARAGRSWRPRKGRPRQDGAAGADGVRAGHQVRRAARAR